MSATRVAVPGRVVDVRPAGHTRVRLFCFPYAGGGAGSFRGWQAGLPDEMELVPVYLPGRERRFREAPHTRLEPLAAELAEALRPHLDLPFALLGHSMGASIAFELARLFEAEGQVPVHLFVSGRRAPHLPRETEEIHALPEAEFARRVCELGGTPDEVMSDPELMELLLPILRADFTLSETYAYREGPPLAAPITALGGNDDAYARGHQLEAWREQTRDAFRAQQFPGGHFFINAHRDEILRGVRDDLARSLSRR